ncbi:dTDP-4-dehydrorhamnose reductase [Sutcliffiella horikoshii]|nr:dTDP-4-dehydrorhamnose reductase [Sutcliffiella horikoshii]
MRLLKVLVTGAGGQLGLEILKKLKYEKIQVIGLNKSEMDVTNIKIVRKLLLKHKPNVVIHTAAYTNVALAEKEPEKAFQVNSEGTKNVAEISELIGAVLCYISTDYVFDGESETAYNESDVPNPKNTYGTSKYKGEKFVQEHCSKYFIVRTSWLYGIHGSNFVEKMIKKAKSEKVIEVVADQFGSPTYTKDLAIFLSELIETDKFGIYHATNYGSCSWYEFACEIFKELKQPVKIKPITSEKYMSGVSRPKNSVLENNAIVVNGFSQLPYWQYALKNYFKCLNISK